MAPYNYGAVQSDDVEKAKVAENDPLIKSAEKATYDLSFAFQLMSGVVWFSFSLWGVWIAAFYGGGAVRRDWNSWNIIFPDLYSPDYRIASVGIGVHLIGAAYMALAGAFQLVKYVRKKYPSFHRWVGRGYIIASMIASLGGLTFILFKGDYGGRPADYAFGTYGLIFLICGVMTYVHARKRDFNIHRLWAWRLYSLSLAAWIWRFDYHYWMALFGNGQSTWLHAENFQGYYDYFENWAFWVPGLIVVEIVYRWGESGKTVSSFWSRFLDLCWGVITVMAVIFTFHAFFKLWVPTIVGSYKSGFY